MEVVVKKNLLLSILLLPGVLWCPGTPEVSEPLVPRDVGYAPDAGHGPDVGKYEPLHEEFVSGGEGVLTGHEDLFVDADVPALLERPDVLNNPVEGLPTENVQQFQAQNEVLPTVTTPLDPLANLDVQEQPEVVNKEAFIADLKATAYQGGLINDARIKINDLNNYPNATYADYARILQEVADHLQKIIDLQNRLIDFDYSDEQQLQIDRYQDMLDAQINSGRDLLAQLQEPLERKALTDLPMINKKLEALQAAFGKIDKSRWWGGKSLADVARQLNELHLILDNVVTITPDASYKETIQNMKDIVQMLDQKLVKVQLDALRNQDLITRSGNAIAILESQPAVGYTVSSRGKAEMQDAGQVLKELAAILLDDPLYHERYLKAHDELAFERLNHALDAKGIERADDETEEAFLTRTEVQALQKELFPKAPDVGVWKDSLDFNVALANARYLREIYEAKKGMQKALKKDYNVAPLVKAANKRFTSKKRDSKTEFFPVEDSQSQGRGSIASQ